MKKWICLLLCIWLSLFSITSAENNFSAECYTQKYSGVLRSEDRSAFLLTDSKNIVVMQENKQLNVFSKKKSHSYMDIELESDNGILTESDEYDNLYSIEALDTAGSREITINFPYGQAVAPNQLVFEHDAKNYKVEYLFIEDDGLDWPVDIYDKDFYYPLTIKISFLPRNNTNIREKIGIRRIGIKERKNVFQVNNLKENTPITIYTDNSCERENIEYIEDVSSLGFPKNHIKFQKNELYIQKINDTDKDGIGNLYDNCVNIQNADQADINQNGIGDACEFDSDADGVPDHVDNCRNVANPDQKDDDNDAIGNLCDNCEKYNPKQIDQDNNGIGDVCDRQQNYLNQNDADGDKILDHVDNCPKISNPLQEDSDNDRIGDACDNCKSYINTDQLDQNENGIGDICEDSDNDGINGLEDNCINHSNPEQTDDDNDGIGNICEDDDNDKVLFIDDNCPHKSNHDQRDTDNDGIGDACDNDDNRIIESNKYVFILLMILVAMLFSFAIYAMAEKLKSNS